MPAARHSISQARRTVLQWLWWLGVWALVSDRVWFKSQTGVTLGKVSALPDPVSLPRAAVVSPPRAMVNVKCEMREKTPDTVCAHSK